METTFVGGKRVLEFRSHERALRFLTRFASQPANMVTIRSALLEKETAAGASDLSDEQVLDRVAWMLVSGDFAVLASGQTQGPRFVQTSQDPEDIPVEKPAPVWEGDQQTEQPHWIELSLVDEEKNPVADQPYWIQLPDGEILEGKLDDKGFIRIDDIPNGDCLVKFPGVNTDEIHSMKNE